MMSLEKKENLSSVLVRIAIGLAACQLVGVILILGFALSPLHVPDIWGVVYFLGEIFCTFCAVPIAIIALVLNPDCKNGRTALFTSIAAAGLFAFFYVFPS